MKHIVVAISLALMSVSAHAKTRRGGEVPVQITQGLISSRANAHEVSVVVSGYLPGECYTWSRAEYVATGDHTYDINAYAYMTSGPCHATLTPYSEEIVMQDIGSGELKLHFRNPDGTSFVLTKVVTQ